MNIASMGGTFNLKRQKPLFIEKTFAFSLDKTVIVSTFARFNFSLLKCFCNDLGDYVFFVLVVLRTVLNNR